jgi:hypothetical protein
MISITKIIYNEYYYDDDYKKFKVEFSFFLFKINKLLFLFIKKKKNSNR